MSEAYIGEIRLFAGNYAPEGWAMCDGRLLAIGDNDALFSLIGTTYGGDGRSTFALPDLRGRLPMGQGAGPGLMPRSIGQQLGTENVSLLEQQIPAHSHNFVASTAAAESSSPANALLGDTEGDVFYVESSNPELQTMDSKAVTNTGDSQPHNNIMSSLAMNYIISLVGIYPPRN